MLLGALLPSSSSGSGALAARGSQLFAETAYEEVMHLCSKLAQDEQQQQLKQGVVSLGGGSSSSNSSSSLPWGSGGSVQLLHLAAVWHAIMRARARSYESYQDR